MIYQQVSLLEINFYKIRIMHRRCVVCGHLLIPMDRLRWLVVHIVFYNIIILLLLYLHQKFRSQVLLKLTDSIIESKTRQDFIKVCT